MARFSPTDGPLKPIGTAAEVENPFFICVHASADVLFAVSEISNFNGGNSGSLSSWRIDQCTGRLSHLSERSSGGPNPCHVTLDQSSNVALVANYGDGSVATFCIDRDGRLDEIASVHRQTGRSIDVHRQAVPHALGVFVSPSNQLVVAPDLGSDQLYLYLLDAQNAKMTPNQPARIRVAFGTGPRHFVFHPRGAFVYLTCELNSTIVIYRCDAKCVSLAEVRVLSATIPGFYGKSEAAEIAVDREGRPSIAPIAAPITLLFSIWSLEVN